MAEAFYTLASWRVASGREEEFLRAWRDELAAAIREMNPGATGTLVQSLDDPRLFYSFGAWRSEEEMRAVRASSRSARRSRR
jgi:heme-degrading monooxygenase HmoA